jgi:uncharacterized membrane protein (DUF2068 family)
MSSVDSPSLLLRLVVFKKLLLCLVFLAVALFSLLGSLRYEHLPELLHKLLDHDNQLLAQAVERGISLGPRGLRRIGVVSIFLTLLGFAAAWATLQQRLWGEWVFIGLLLFALPLEINKALASHHLVEWLLVLLTVVGVVVLVRELRTHSSDVPYKP